MKLSIMSNLPAAASVSGAMGPPSRKCTARHPPARGTTATARKDMVRWVTAITDVIRVTAMAAGLILAQRLACLETCIGITPEQAPVWRSYTDALIAFVETDQPPPRLARTDTPTLRHSDSKSPAERRTRTAAASDGSCQRRRHCSRILAFFRAESSPHCLPDGSGPVYRLGAGRRRALTAASSSHIQPPPRGQEYRVDADRLVMADIQALRAVAVIGLLSSLLN
ncbi:hypothetical protein [Gemmobacter sp. 24YEA27]|uniref:hypothetical protein n=1 Tax=Gemmobacter sp. 24YEA27 TaxID=3040672 RepID=UPI0024B3C31D|nr:hypothetical protein [Gemmobacter sp. 24YEA27]